MDSPDAALGMEGAPAPPHPVIAPQKAPTIAEMEARFSSEAEKPSPAHEISASRSAHQNAPPLNHPLVAIGLILMLIFAGVGILFLLSPQQNTGPATAPYVNEREIPPQGTLIENPAAQQNSSQNSSKAAPSPK